MSETEKIKERPTKAQKIVIAGVVIFLGLVLVVALCIAIYLASPLPAKQLSRFVTSYLHQNFKVEKLQTSGGTLVLKGVRLENPAGFPKGNLALADSVTLSPVWGDVVFGRQRTRYRLVELQGFKINLDKNSKGVWNYSQLRQLFAARKPSGAETFVRELVVKDGAVTVQGEGVHGINLKVHNLSTKGNLDSNLDLAFEDGAGNRYLVTGKGRGGKDAVLDITLSAPSLSLQNASRFLKLKDAATFQQGRGSLQVKATLNKGNLTTSGDLTFTGVKVPAADKYYPVEGALHFSGNYSAETDAAHLETLTLTVNDVMTVNARGNVRGVQGSRDFALYMDMEEVDLGTLNVLLSDQKRKDLFLGGRLRCDSLHILGNRSGLKSAVGTLELRDGSVSKERRVLAAGITGTVGLFRKDSDILAKGKLSLSGPHEEALLQELNLPFTVVVSSKLKPVMAEVPALAARVLGIPVTGRLAYDAGKEAPLAAALKAPATNLSSPAVNAQLKRFDVHADAGTAAVAVDLSGQGAEDLSGTVDVQLSNFRGNRGSTKLAAKKGALAAKIARGAGHLQSQGDVQLTSLVMDGKTADLQSHFRVSDKMLYLDGTRASSGGVVVTFSHLSGPIPAKEVTGTVTRLPLNFDLEGGEVKRGQVEVESLSGRVRATLNSEGASRWLEGSADLTSTAVKSEGKKVGAAALRASFARSGGKEELNGQLLGGRLSGSAAFDPFAKEPVTPFQLSLTGADLTSAAALMPKGGGVSPSAGRLDLHAKGNYSARGGLSCTFDSKGSGIALTGRNKKTIVSGARLSLAGNFSGGTLVVNDAVLTPGEGVSMRLKGEVKQALSPKREGMLSFSLPQSNIDNIVDPFANSLPPLLQEATFNGSLGADGRIRLHQGTQLVEGGVSFKSARIEVASQKLLVTDMNGKLPISFDLSGKAGAKPRDALDFSRENYKRLLDKLRRSSGGGEVITIGKIGFGAVETGRVTMNLTAANGVTQIESLNGAIFNGSFLGKGFVRMGDKLSYRGDMLVNDVSLRSLCSAFGNIKGYISGRVDGVISLSGEGSGQKAMTGFIHLWARQGKDEKMVVSKEFLQRLAKQKLGGFLFRTDRPYDKAEIKAMLEGGDLTFETLVIQHTNFFGVRDLNVNIAPGQNRIGLDHLLESIKEAAVRAPSTGGAPPPDKEQEEAPAGTQEFKWGE